ncbi:hypothetical protein HDU93_001042 [Gonapodya sp. JEL0774]|nr:hypothetical protein HDU93_001042 [Gonapodya sp. JEL0774]
MVSGALYALEVKNVGEAGSKVDQAYGGSWMTTAGSMVEFMIHVLARGADQMKVMMKMGTESGGAPGLVAELYCVLACVSINVSEPATGGSKEVGQEPFDSDIGFFRDDPDEIVSSFENAKKWAMEFICTGGIQDGMTVELKRVYCRW